MRAPLLVALGFALVTLFAAAPMLWPGTPVAMSARIVFAGLCHQEAARSFSIDGHAMAVCHRCAGIYAGLALGALAAFAIAADPRSLRVWALGGAPLALQVLLAWAWPALDLWWLRTATGLVAGGVGGLLLARALGGAAGRVTPRP